ncbi:MFS transporter [Parabacteroides sp. AGMB00274]|uniref:MFS transporter n=1 Tax=Parabacteroides faecalis TaxID=2924040 RepID=A0ABT0C5D9_9BACT|nr:MFS transporter [Parabacteroides faecalis]MCI7287731.1 MFS transporter [Parabacteroides sp.]MCJ2382217.1 MFS transporter [Parabacteroides faecalis]MDD6952252.1 MFS transporter [Parabacteroides sp.]MDY6254677.1 MFS transporter [Bacteroidales bacterium]
MSTKQKSMIWMLIPVMFSFFTMGFVDLVGIATNYVKADFQLSDTLANLLPSMVFFWFLIFSVPTGMLMNKIGQRKTVLLSIVVTVAALLLPLLNYSFASMLISFSLLGIGNTLMQVSLNPLLSNIVSGNRLASTLTLGQFVKAIASFLAPIIAGWAAVSWGNWKLLFLIFLVIAVIACVLLGMTHIDESSSVETKSSTFGECFALLADKVVLISFLGIICHVGIDVGLNLTAPKLLMERLDMTLTGAGLATSVYFLFRTIGCFSGAFLLAYFPMKKVFTVSVLMMVAAMIGLFTMQSLAAHYVCIALVGLGNSNIFSMLFTRALLHLPNRKNEVSGLMIMGLFGGTIFPLFMGIVSDWMQSQIGAVAVMSIGVLYLLSIIPAIRKD